MDGDAGVAFFDAAHGGDGCPHALCHGVLRDAAAAAGQRQVVTQLANGALDREGHEV